MNKNLLILLLALCVHVAYAQNGDYTIGARSASLAGSSVTLEDQWTLFNNIGNLSYVQHTSVFASYRNLYALPELSSMATGVALPVLGGTMGIGVFRFGSHLFNEQRMNLGFSNRFGLVSLGVNAGYFQMNIEGGGTRNAFMFDFGGHARLSEQFTFAAHISNVNQARLSTKFNERIPTIMKSGISYRPSRKLMINGEIQKSVERVESLKLGLEYEIIGKIYARTGISTKPFTSNFGVGIYLEKIIIDYAYGNHNNLGEMHQFSFSYKIKE